MIANVLAITVGFMGFGTPKKKKKKKKEKKEKKKRDANGKASSGGPDQTDPRGAV